LRSRVAEATLDEDMAATMHRRPGFRAGRIVLLLAALTAFAGCSSAGMDRGASKLAESGTAAGVPADLPNCGRVPTSLGPAAATATLVLTAPAIAAAGSSCCRHHHPRGTRGRRPDHRHASHVAAAHCARPASSSAQGARPVDGSVPLPLRARTSRPVRLLPAEIRLVGCPTGAGSGRALPPGRYELVAVLGYRLDPLNASAEGAVPTGSQGHPFTLVSWPVPITIG